MKHWQCAIGMHCFEANLIQKVVKRRPYYGDHKYARRVRRCMLCGKVEIEKRN